MRTPVNSFEFHPCGRTPQVDYLTLSLGRYTVYRITASNHRLRRGLPGYLILFATHAFVPQRQLWLSTAAFAIGVPDGIYAFHRYTINSIYPIHTQANQYQWHFHG